MSLLLLFKVNVVSVDLVVENNVHEHVSDSIAIGQTHILNADGNSHSVVSENVAITQTHILEVTGNSHEHYSDSIAIEQTHVLEPAGNIHEHYSDNVTIETTVPAVVLVIEDNSHELIMPGVKIFLSVTFGIVRYKYRLPKPKKKPKRITIVV